MQFRSRLALAAALAVLGLGVASAGAVPLLPHKATYRLSLDGSKPSGQLEEMNGEIQYEITGDACAGYSTLTRQESVASTGEGKPLRQAVTSRAWEDGEAKAYRFLSTSDGDDGDDKIEAKVERQGRDRLRVTVAQPEARTLELKGEILLPTEHVKRVLAAAAAGESVFEAKVYDGANDPAKVYETLAVLGRPNTDESRAAAPAKESLKGRTFYPITISYFETGGVDRAPAYVMSMQLYDNGVVGSLKIDYGKFALIGAMSAFEALKVSDGCAK
ncbi:cell envelope integrity EipB family protein [Xanthobacter autotrophicus]|uniref:cell envelope integrity EipB family protein n=1 Tax=Xanthobacter TaxID=279 RepID=UPI0024AA611B|nr:cell envelope integrity EipB family protein [Xanthobacter autotrophicus]MDI4666121.1 cell envelope integrity EipB family protein [Xanthobacter autotrophicus]